MSSSTTRSFVEIQRMQEMQATPSTSKDKRSLRDIQEEERARQQEAEFLKWWAREEERARLEMLEQERQQERASAGPSIQNKNKKGGKARPRKPKAETRSGTSSQQELRGRQRR